MIQEIHFFGTSHTAGGGFEFTSNILHENTGKSRGEFLKSVYQNLFPNEEYTQENFSFPGQFERLCKERDLNIKILNHGKQGYGNERMYRKFFEVIKNKNFKKENTLFIFEFSDIERKEVFYKPLNDFVIINYFATTRNFYTNEIKIPKKPHEELSSVARSYWYESSNDLDILENDKKFFENYVEKLIDGKTQLDELNRNNIFFLNFLKSNNFNFLISEIHNCFDTSLIDYVNFVNDSKVRYMDSNNIEYKGLLDFVHKNQLLIIDETSEKIGDLHQGFLANKLIAKNIFNYCIDSGYINEIKIEIKKEDFLKPKIKKTEIL